MYLYSEFVEAEFLDESQSMFNTMNPFHMQTFDTASAVRALEANGFGMVFCTIVDRHFAALATRADDVPAAWGHMSERERERRIRLYRIAADHAVLQMPEALRGRVADQWDRALERSLANETAQIQKNGRIKVQPPKDAKK
jgi:hypothetical protein